RLPMLRDDVRRRAGPRAQRRRRAEPRLAGGQGRARARAGAHLGSTRPALRRRGARGSRPRLLCSRRRGAPGANRASEPRSPRLPSHRRARPGSRPGPRDAGTGDFDGEALWDGGQQAPLRADGRDRGLPGVGLVGRELLAGRAVSHAGVAPVPRQLDRGRELRDPAQHHRQASAWSAGLKDDTMSNLLPEDREATRQGARTFVRDRAPVSHLRALRDARDPLGYSRELWREMAGLGFAGMTIPQRFGGGGLGFMEQGAVLEELGRNLVPAPIVSAILGAGALALGGADELQSILSRVCMGEQVVALAHQEGRRYAPY